MSQPNVRIDLLLGSVKHLRQGKSYLENKLQDKRAKNAELRTSLDAASSKHDQASDMNFKINALLKVALHKVTKTQCQISVLREHSSQKSQRIEELNRCIANEDSRRTTDSQTFCDQLTEMASLFSDARSANKETELEASIEKEDNAIGRLDMEGGEREMETETLQKKIESLTLEKGKFSPFQTSTIIVCSSTRYTVHATAITGLPGI